LLDPEEAEEGLLGLLGDTLDGLLAELCELGLTDDALLSDDGLDGDTDDAEL
jgi:hypothetical protein